MIPHQLRTGFGGEGLDQSAADREETIVALMRVFTKEACEVAAVCAQETGRRNIGAEDIRRALMFVSRTFFQTKSDEELHAVVTEERAVMQDETDDDETDDDGTDDDETDDDDDDGTDGDGTDGDDETDGDDGTITNSVNETANLSARVQAVVDGWHAWTPNDPVHVMLKRAIDAVDESRIISESIVSDAAV